jgi:hypothetical protein
MQKMVPALSNPWCLAVTLCASSWAASAAATPISVGTLDGSRTSLPFDGGAFTRARAALGGSFDDVIINAYPTIPNNPGDDLLFITNAGMTTPLSAEEQDALLGFVNMGGMLLLGVFSDGSQSSQDTAASLLSPFGASTSGALSTAETFYPTIPNAPAPLFDGVTGFTTANASEVDAPADQTIAIASGLFGPLLVYYPTIPNNPVPRLGQVIVYSNPAAFADGAAGGHFSSNQRLFLNAANAAAVAVPSPGPVGLLILALLPVAVSRALVQHPG